MGVDRDEGAIEDVDETVEEPSEEAVDATVVDEEELEEDLDEDEYDVPARAPGFFDGFVPGSVLCSPSAPGFRGSPASVSPDVVGVAGASVRAEPPGRTMLRTF